MRLAAFTALRYGQACAVRPNDEAKVVVQVMDFGYPQFTEAKILSEFIKTDAYKMEVQFSIQLSCCAIRTAYQILVLNK